MNEFIVWDKKENKFDNELWKYVIDTDGRILQRSLTNTSTLFIIEGIKAFSYIGKKDINNKKIYSNSSILLLNYFSDSDWISDYGYFLWDDEDLRYNVSLIGEMEIVPFENSSFDLLEIVDTIQENKLGLIKCN